LKIFTGFSGKTDGFQKLWLILNDCLEIGIGVGVTPQGKTLT
jgi:hypothetical protein